MQISRWGNSLAVRIPAKTVKALALKEGDEVDVALTLVEATSVPSVEEKRFAAVERLLSLRGTLTQEDLNYTREELYNR